MPCRQVSFIYFGYAVGPGLALFRALGRTGGIAPLSYLIASGGAEPRLTSGGEAGM